MSTPNDLGFVGHLLLPLTLGKQICFIFSSYWETTKLYCARYGIITGLALVTIFAPDGPRLIERIDTNVLPAKSRDVKDFMSSLAFGFNMTGVAAAIIAQVAVTGLSSNDGTSLHWTVNAFYLVGAVSAGLSVYFACIAHPALRGLDSSTEIKVWLSRPAAPNAHPKSSDEFECYRHASAYSVMMLLAPNRLLNISVPSLLVALGIPLGILITNTNSSSPNTDAIDYLPIFIIYLCTGVLGFATYFLPSIMKELEKYGEKSQSRSSLPQSTVRNGVQRHKQQTYDPNLPVPSAMATHRQSSGATPAPGPKTQEQNLDSVVVSRLPKDSHDRETVNTGHSSADGNPDLPQPDSLDSILRELLAAQVECTNLTQKLLEYHRRES